VIQEWDLWDETKDSQIKPGDLVIARCSSSLVDLHLKMIVQGIPCNLVGSSLQQDLLNLLEDIAEQTGFEYQKLAQRMRRRFCYLLSIELRGWIAKGYI
jgi:DNA helicase II / ATP-dependent DNA helicase PcrA